ncbi:hypothetical protein SAMN04487925_10165 [Bradyrhizobium sp. cf659]|nr:hypothetical protein SAMN04487925_10165 [Bradyrhizobium sp. cf659]
MTERLLSPYRRAGKLLSLVRDLASFCEQHQHRDLAGGLSFDELHQVERELAEVAKWMQQLGVCRAPKARAAEREPVDDECF